MPICSDFKDKEANVRICQLLICGILVLCVGCVTGRNVRKLSDKEIEIMGKTHSRLKENKQLVFGSLDDMRDSAAMALADQQSLKLSLSKAKLLESMKSPWAQPHGDMVTTQREVVLYHLYALAEAEQSALDAQLLSRDESIKEIKKAYTQLVTSMGALIESQKLLLTHLNQPANSRLTAFIGTVLAEAKAFRETFDASENPRLKELAADVKASEEKVQTALEQINKAMEFTLSKKGR